MTAERRWQNQIPPLPTVRQLGNFSSQVITFPGFETSAYAKSCESSSPGTTGFLQGLLQDEAVASLSCATLLCQELQYHQAMTATFGFKSRPERQPDYITGLPGTLPSFQPPLTETCLLPGSTPLPAAP